LSFSALIAASTPLTSAVLSMAISAVDLRLADNGRLDFLLGGSEETFVYLSCMLTAVWEYLCLKQDVITKQSSYSLTKFSQCHQTELKMLLNAQKHFVSFNNININFNIWLLISITTRTHQLVIWCL
jgi:hypothetical protein